MGEFSIPSLAAELRERLAEVREQLAGVDELRAEEAKLQAALAALESEQKRPKAAPRSGARSRPKRRATKKPAAPGETRAAIVAFLSANPGSSAAAVSAATGLKRGSASTLLTKLSKEGAIERAAGRGYQVPGGAATEAQSAAEPVVDVDGEVG